MTAQEASLASPNHIVMLLAFIVLVLLSASMPSLAAPTLDDQVEAIAGELMCPVCEGQTVAESNSPLAAQMRAQIRERVASGHTKDEILAYFVAQFGEAVLAAPPKRGAGLALWLSPILALAVGVMTMARYLRRVARPATPSLS